MLFLAAMIRLFNAAAGPGPYVVHLMRLRADSNRDARPAGLPCDVLVIKPSRFRSSITRKPRGMRAAAPAPFVSINA